METRISVVGIIIEDPSSVASVNQILTEYSDIIIGRIGLPYKEKDLRIISIVIDGTTDAISAITGKIGRLQGISVKAAISKR